MFLLRPFGAMAIVIAVGSLSPFPALAADAPSAVSVLRKAYEALAAAVEVDADSIDPADMDAARSRYEQGVKFLATDAAQGRRLGEQAWVLGDLAAANARAAHAAEQLASAQSELDELEKSTKPKRLRR